MVNADALTPSHSDGSLLRHLADGQQTAADALYRRYAHRIRALARAKFPCHLNNRLDSDDVVQSVFRAFFDRARKGLYQVPDGDTLWNLLAVVTLNKVRSLHEYHVARRRDVRATVEWCSDTADAEADSDSALMELAVRDVLNHLPESERTAVELRLEGYEVAEIAGRVGRSKRSVERSLQKAREHLGDLIGSKC